MKKQANVKPNNKLRLKRCLRTSPVCPCSVSVGRSVCISHTFSVPSAEPETRYRPSSDRVTLFTYRECACSPPLPRIWRLGWAVRMFHMIRSPFLKPVTASSFGKMAVTSGLASNFNMAVH